MTGDDLTGTFTEQKGAVRSFAMLRDSAAAHTTVLVTSEPFLGSTPRVYGGRWGTRSTPPQPAEAADALRRQVPLDVVLAGGELRVRARFRGARPHFDSQPMRTRQPA